MADSKEGLEGKISGLNIKDIVRLIPNYAHLKKDSDCMNSVVGYVNKISKRKIVLSRNSPSEKKVVGKKSYSLRKFKEIIILKEGKYIG